MRVYKFDVTLARELTADGREPVEVDDESVILSLEDCKIYSDHVDHVDPKYPGIIAHVEFPYPNGEIIRGHVLIDGNHRSARCLRDGLPFFAYLLTEDESRSVLLRGPKITSVPEAAG